MLSIDSILSEYSFDEFNYWFIINNDLKSFAVVDKQTNAVISSIPATYDEVAFSGDEIKEPYKEEFIRFQHRPEFSLCYLPEELSNHEKYEMYLAGSFLTRIYRKILTAKSTASLTPYNKGLLKCLEWLRGTDFYVAPASSRYHDSYEGGLLDHTLRVVANILDLKKLNKFNSVNIESAVFVSLVHDWCKIDLYESYMRNVKNDATGQWEQMKSYRHKGKTLLSMGHGVSSMFLCERFFKLSTDEALAIRWHMGVWNVSENEVNELQQSNETTPLVHMLQFADQLSITEY